MMSNALLKVKFNSYFVALNTFRSFGLQFGVSTMSPVNLTTAVSAGFTRKKEV